MKIAVVGAGPIGLVAGVALEQAGHSIQIFKSSIGLRAEGAGLTISPNGYTALQALGLSDALEDTCHTLSPSASYGIRDSQGNWLSKFNPELTSKTKIVKRQEFSEALFQKLHCPPLFGKSADSVEDGVIRFSNGEESEQYDLVISADGIHSSLRHHVFEKTALSYAGYRVWRGISHSPQNVSGFGEFWGVGGRFGIMPLPNNQYYWFATENIEKEYSYAIDLTALKKTFPRLASRYRNDAKLHAFSNNHFPTYSRA